MWVRAAIDAERERILEYLLVTVRRREVQGDHLAGAVGRLARGLPRRAVLGVLLADPLVGPAEQQLPVVARNAEDPCDHRQREGRRYALDEVELARRARGRRLAEDVDRDPVDVGA